jgi:hypothetical protein
LLRLAAIGDIEFVSGHALTTLDWIIILVFIVVMAIVMVNVLIAVVTNSFDESMGSSAHVFWASRLLLVYDMTMTWSASGLLSKVASLRKSLGGELNYYRITKEEFEPQGRTRRQVVGRINDISNAVNSSTLEIGSRIMDQVASLAEEVQALKRESKLNAAFDAKLATALETLLERKKEEDLALVAKNTTGGGGDDVLQQEQRAEESASASEEEEPAIAFSPRRQRERRRSSSNSSSRTKKRQSAPSTTRRLFQSSALPSSSPLPRPSAKFETKETSVRFAPDAESIPIRVVSLEDDPQDFAGPPPAPPTVRFG